MGFKIYIYDSIQEILIQFFPVCIIYNPYSFIISSWGIFILSGYLHECIIRAFNSIESNSSFILLYKPAAKLVILGVEKLVPAETLIFPSNPKDFTPLTITLPFSSIPAFPPICVIYPFKLTFFITTKTSKKIQIITLK